MKFQEWAEKLEEHAEQFSHPTPLGAMRKVWRCEGLCGQWMYGIDRRHGWNYPSPENLPSSLYINTTYVRVCRVCWDLFHVLELSDSSYWKKLSKDKNAETKRNRLGEDYLHS